jgi:hypothetical protein
MRLHRTMDRLVQIRPLLTGCYPSFVYPGVDRRPDVVPIFVQHELNLETFKETLEYLHRNGYRTLHCDELAGLMSDGQGTGNEVMLTFDDGLRWLYEVAFPVLKQFDVKVVAFVCPGLIEDHHGRGEDPDSNLCTWAQLSEMIESGLVDVQCHGLRHARVWVSPDVIGFLTARSRHVVRDERLMPAFRRNAFGNGSTPRCPTPGAPVRPHRPALRSPRRFDDAALAERCMLAIDRYGPRFYENVDWLKGHQTGELGATGRWVEGEERAYEMLDALVQARHLLEDHLSPASARHFAWPWWRGCAMAEWAVREAGFRTAFGGPDAYRFRQRTTSLDPYAIPRMSLDWHARLPGIGRKTFAGLIGRKLRGR